LSSLCICWLRYRLWSLTLSNIQSQKSLEKINWTKLGRNVTWHAWMVLNISFDFRL
jgi:hypothetical protein